MRSNERRDYTEVYMKKLWVHGYVYYLDCGDGFTDTYISELTQFYILKSVDYMLILPQHTAIKILKPLRY